MNTRTSTTPSSAAGAGAGPAIPRAPSLPLVGSIPALLLRRLDFFERAREQCGDIFVIDLGINEVVIVADPDAAEQIFISRSKNFDKGEVFWEGLREAIGNGLALSEGELWRRQRRLMNPEFRRERIASFRATISQTIDELLDELPQHDAGGRSVEISAWTSNLLATLTVRLLLGAEVGPEALAKIRDALAVMFGDVLAGLVTRKLPGWMPVPGAARFEQARASLDEVVLGMIAQRRREGGEPRGDLLGMLLAATDEQGAMSDQQLRDEVIVTYVAGYETTAWALAWGLQLLAEHPMLVAELQDELDAHDDASDDVMTIPLLDATVREILRLYPSAPFIPRRAAVDEQLLGYPIKAGTTVVVMPWLLHRNPKHWPNPLRFDPRRHLEPSDRPRLAWMPFGAGQRVCIGQGLAMMEATLTLAALLRRFTPMPARDHARAQPRLSVTLSADKGVWIQLVPRSA